MIGRRLSDRSRTRPKSEHPTVEHRRAAAGRWAEPNGGRRTRDVLIALTVAELRASHELSIAGVARWILEPVSYMFVYFILVAAILNRPEFAFPLFLLCALVPFRFFTGAVNGSMSLVQRYSSVVANTAVPTFVLPLMRIVVEGMDMLVALLLFVPMVIYYGVDVWPSILWLPVALVTLVLLSAGPTFLGTLFGLYYPDLRGVAQNLLRASFFVSTGLVAISRVPGEELPKLFRANPLSGVFDTFRAVFLHGTTPDLIDVVYPPLVGLLLLLIAVPIYRARARHLPKEV